MTSAIDSSGGRQPAAASTAGPCGTAQGWPSAEESDDADGPWDHRRTVPADPLPLFPHPDLLLVDALNRPLAKMPTPMDSAINRTDGTPSTVTWRPPAASDASAAIAVRVAAATARQSAVSAHHIARVGRVVMAMLYLAPLVAVQQGSAAALAPRTSHSLGHRDFADLTGAISPGLHSSPQIQGLRRKLRTKSGTDSRSRAPSTARLTSPSGSVQLAMSSL